MIVALCGNPDAGKTEVQKILERLWHVTPVDDGWPLRDFAIRHLRAKIEHVTTQEGKATRVRMPGGRTMLWREFLGEFGNAIEAILGPDAIPEMALDASARHKRRSFGSVRREQGAVYRRAGGIVVGIESAWAPPSPHEFDRFNADHVHVWIRSQTKDLVALERKVVATLKPYLA